MNGFLSIAAQVRAQPVRRGDFGSIIPDGFLEAVKAFGKFPVAVDGGEGYAQEVLLPGLPDGKSA